MSDDLVGLTIVADTSLRRHDDGRVLVGGSPLRVVRLAERGARHLDNLLDGEPVPSSPGVLRLVRRLLDIGLVQPAPRSSPHSLSDVTVVIPVLGSLDPELLDGIGRVARIVVVDDGSDPAMSAPTITAHGVRVDLRRRPHRGGPGAARNTGLAEVDTPLVAFVDADCAPRPGWLDPLLLQFADPRVALVAPRIVAAEPRGDTGRNRLVRYERSGAALDLGAERGRVRARSRIAYVPSAAVCARTGVMVAMGGFDESMPVGEDVDLVWRLDEAGWTVRYEPEARVAHRHRTTLWSWLRRRYDYGTSAGPLARRHPGALVPVEASGWSYATWGLAAAGHPAAAAVTVGATAGVLERHLRGVDRPMLTAANLTVRGHLAAGRSLTRALVRPWWPIALLAAVVVPSRRLRLVIAGAVIAPAAIKWYRDRPDLDPMTFLGLHLAEDVAYSTGVWMGCARARTLEPITPELTAWPTPNRYSRWRAERTAAD